MLGCETRQLELCGHHCSFPIPAGTTERCGGPGRGYCLKLEDVHEFFWPPLTDHLLDDRINWPKRFFQFACACDDNFQVGVFRRGKIASETLLAEKAAKREKDHFGDLEISPKGWVNSKVRVPPKGDTDLYM